MQKEPFNKTIAEIARLTDFQISNLMQRDEDSEPTKREGWTSKTPQQSFYEVWKARGLSHAEIKAKWNSDYPNDTPWEDIE